MNTLDLSDLTDHLAQINRKLDYVVERQRFIEDLIDEMTPVGRDALSVAAVQLGEMEAKGYFSVGNELLAMVDRVVQAYGVEDVRGLSENIVSILDTVRNVTQPDVLAAANQATDVLHHADEVDPIGPLGMVRATHDPDVQHGLAIALEVLRQIGRMRGDASAPPPRPSKPTAATRRGAPPASKAALPEQCDVPAKPEPTSETVMWEGHAFDSKGFLLDASVWDEALAEKMAAALSIELGPDHWTVIRWVRQDFVETGASPNVRRVAIGSGLGTKRVYELFPKSPGKTAAMIAGVPKPVGCV